MVPRLFLSAWQEPMYEFADVVLFLPAGSKACPLTIFEPLVIAISFRILNYRHYQVEQTPKL